MIKVNTRAGFLKRLSELLPESCHGVEVGVFQGDFSSQILKIVNPTTLILVDPFESNTELTYGAELQYLPTAYSTDKDYYNVMERFEKEITSGQVAVSRKYSLDAANDFYSRMLDFVYIDASHLYEDVKNDLIAWMPKVKSGGLICGHDYTHYSNFGVIQAVDEFCMEAGYEMILFNESEGDYALKKI
jgi:Methyltransferase domain